MTAHDRYALTPESPVLILGAGINGCALARELAVNGVPVVLVDAADIATGATAKSSRLIHGGIRYLEYGDFRLVRESLVERERLLTTAPQFVRPLPLVIPVERRFGGLLASAVKFVQLGRTSPGRWLLQHPRVESPRGLIAVRLGLWLYDRLAGRSRFPRSTVVSNDGAAGPAVDHSKYRWLCRYWDAQMLLPERFVLALLEDARGAAAQHGVEFRVFTYHRLEPAGLGFRIVPTWSGDIPGSRADSPDARSVGAGLEIRPAIIVNATGAWGDLTLEELRSVSSRPDSAPHRPLLGGTKGSHFLTRQPSLIAALGEEAVYAEAGDGRLIFILPLDGSVLVGTTDERFPHRPETAIATEAELTYLAAMVNEVFPQVRLTRDDIDAHYCGVRPLPNSEGGKTAAISRGHSVHHCEVDGRPVLTLIGGKLTTCRMFAEDAANRVFDLLRIPRRAGTQQRPVPGAEDYPEDPESWCREQARRTGCRVAQARAVFGLAGTRAAAILEEISSSGDSGDLPGTPLPLGFVDWSIRHEWVTRLEDLVERRLGLVFAAPLEHRTLDALADRLIAAGVMREADRGQRLAECAETLKRHYGSRLRG
jgi:glycerol-3-phosphate dehydrogenase